MIYRLTLFLRLGRIKISVSEAVKRISLQLSLRYPAAIPEVSRSEKKVDGVVNYWVNVIKLDEGFYHPSLVFVVKEDKVENLELTKLLIDLSK
ncbi:hypothetical protein NST58_20185 [Paenibacillus sp. FSL R10-2796]|uniref:hypothetical protein n=1 Tax=Paenibacillus sp. FSL R10-2796 TaxID=2954663 RepID=UPI0030DD8FA0